MADARAKVVIADQKLDEVRKKKIVQKKKNQEQDDSVDVKELDHLKDDRNLSLGWVTLYAAGAFSLILVICTSLVWVVFRYT